MRKKVISEEQRRMIAEQARARFADPAKRRYCLERMIAGQRTEEARLKRIRSRAEAERRRAEGLWAGPMDEALRGFFKAGRKTQPWLRICVILGVCEQAARKRARFLGLMTRKENIS